MSAPAVASQSLCNVLIILEYPLSATHSEPSDYRVEVKISKHIGSFIGFNRTIVGLWISLLAGKVSSPWYSQLRDEPFC